MGLKGRQITGFQLGDKPYGGSTSIEQMSFIMTLDLQGFDRILAVVESF